MAYEIRRKSPVNAPSEESLLGSIGRNVANIGGRAALSLPTIPGQIQGGLKSLINAGSTALGYPEMQDLRVPRYQVGQGYTDQPSNYPTSQEILSSLGKASGNEKYFEPQSQLAEGAYQLADILPQTLAAGPLRGASTIAQAVIPSAVGVGAKQAAKYAGAGEGIQAGAQLAGDFLTGSVMRGALPKNVQPWAKNLVKEADDIIFKDYKNVWHSAEKIKPFIEDAERFLEEGLSASTLPSKGKIKEILADLRGQMEYGKLTPSKFRRFWKDLNEADGLLRQSPEGYALSGQLRAGIKESLQDYAKTNPKFAPVEQSLNLGTNTLRAIHSLDPEEIGSVLEAAKYIPSKNLKKIFQGVVGGLKKIPKGASLGITDPGTRKYYLEILDAAGKGSIPSALKLSKTLQPPKRFEIRKKDAA